MKSTLERDFVVENGVASFPIKEYPDWYGIPDIGFIWHGICKDPEIEYQGKRVNAAIIENAMWERYTHDDDGNYISVNASDEEGFNHYLWHNKDEVYELIELAMEGCD